MKKFELTLVRREQDKFVSMDKIEADNLVQLLSQFQMVIIMLQNKMHEEEIVRLENDIPF